MNFNHLMHAHALRRKCSGQNNSCYYVPAGNIRSTLGNNVHMTMVCKSCGHREDIFLTESEYNTQKRLIEKELGNV